jgi:hypothetical protein
MKQVVDAATAFWKPGFERFARRIETSRKIEQAVDQFTSHRLERRYRRPFDLVEQAEFCRIVRIGCLGQGRLDAQGTRLER